MWRPFKRKQTIQESKKVGLYRSRYDSSSSSAWDGLSLIEKFCIIVMPIGLTFIDCMVLDLMFGLGLWANIIISVASTILLMILVWWFASWMSGEG